MATRKTSPVPSEEPASREQRGIQSVEVGGQLLLALAHQGRRMALKDLAREAGMAAAKAHPYLVSFSKLGLIEQDQATGWYGLGPLALQLGLMALQQADPVRVATTLMPELAQQLGHTVGVAVWGNRGPTIVHLSESPAVVHVNMRQGTVFSIGDTADYHATVAVPNEDDVVQVFIKNRVNDILNVCVQPDIRSREVYAIALSGELRTIYLKAFVAKHRLNFLERPRTTPRAVNDNNRRF